MSTIVSSFVKDRASAAQLPTASVISGAVKAWAVIDQRNTPTNMASFNVASIGDAGLGRTNVTFTALMSGQEYSVVTGASDAYFGAVVTAGLLINTNATIDFRCATNHANDGVNVEADVARLRCHIAGVLA